MTFFVVRKKSTGELFPVTGRGSTCAVFGDGPPRLFTKRSAAIQCMQWWLLGKTKMVYTPPNWACEGDWDLDTVKDSSRVPNDYEVVEIYLTVKEGTEKPVKEWKETS
jgi:hypothetical protein